MLATRQRLKVVGPIGLGGGRVLSRIAVAIKRFDGQLGGRHEDLLGRSAHDPFERAISTVGARLAGRNIDRHARHVIASGWDILCGITALAGQPSAPVVVKTAPGTSLEHAPSRPHAAIQTIQRFILEEILQALHRHTRLSSTTEQHIPIGHRDRASQRLCGAVAARLGH
ncbi:MAG: hypothetical protein ACI9WU_003656 [Myxococcota bacterium]